jgi:hypothetical protein
MMETMFQMDERLKREIAGLVIDRGTAAEQLYAAFRPGITLEGARSLLRDRLESESTTLSHSETEREIERKVGLPREEVPEKDGPDLFWLNHREGSA